MSIRSLLLPTLLLILAVTGTISLVATGQGERGDGPIAITDLSDEALFRRGEYLAIAGNCAACHTAPSGQALAGGLPFNTPYGVLYSTNITSDPEQGIGAWSDWDFLNSMRYGIRPNGEHLYPAFPYTHFTRVTNEDLLALYHYLQRSESVTVANTPNALDFPFNRRELLGLWKLLYLDSGVFEADVSRGAEWNRGAYLVEGLAHCSACHSPRDSLGGEISDRHMAGGVYTDRVGEEGLYRNWSASDLTSSDRGLGNWTHQQLVDYLGEGRNDFLDTFGPMLEVVMDSTRHLNERDIAAMATYLKDLPASEAVEVDNPDALTMGRGRTVYNLHCGTCHLPTGQGDPEMGPRLNQGSLVVLSANPASLINTILYGPELPHPPLPSRWLKPMKELHYELDDDEVAAVATFVRNSWSNNAGVVTPEQVKRQR